MPHVPEAGEGGHAGAPRPGRPVVTVGRGGRGGGCGRRQCRVVGPSRDMTCSGYWHYAPSLASTGPTCTVEWPWALLGMAGHAFKRLAVAYICTTVTVVTASLDHPRTGGPHAPLRVCGWYDAGSVWASSFSKTEGWPSFVRAQTWICGAILMWDATWSPRLANPRWVSAIR